VLAALEAIVVGVVGVQGGEGCGIAQLSGYLPLIELLPHRRHALQEPSISR